MYNRQFWLDTLERTIRAGAFAAAAAVATPTTLAQDVNWLVVGGTATTAALLAFLTSVGAGRVGDLGTASLLPKRDRVSS